MVWYYYTCVIFQIYSIWIGAFKKKIQFLAKRSNRRKSSNKIENQLLQGFDLFSLIWSQLWFLFNSLFVYIIDLEFSKYKILINIRVHRISFYSTEEQKSVAKCTVSANSLWHWIHPSICKHCFEYQNVITTVYWCMWVYDV